MAADDDQEIDQDELTREAYESEARAGSPEADPEDDDPDDDDDDDLDDEEDDALDDEEDAGGGQTRGRLVLPPIPQPVPGPVARPDNGEAAREIAWQAAQRARREAAAAAAAAAAPTRQHRQAPRTAPPKPRVISLGPTPASPATVKDATRTFTEAYLAVQEWPPSSQHWALWSDAYCTLRQVTPPPTMREWWKTAAAAVKEARAKSGPTLNFYWSLIKYGEERKRRYRLTPAYKAKRNAKKLTASQKASHREAQQRYRLSEAGKAAKRREVATRKAKRQAGG